VPTLASSSEDVNYRPLRYLSYPTIISPSGEVDLGTLLYRSGSQVDGEIPVDVVRAMRYTEHGTYARRRPNRWQRALLPDGKLRLTVPSSTPSQVTGIVTAVAVVVAGEEKDVVAGVVLARSQVHFAPAHPGQLDTREPHIIIPGLSQRFRQYALIRLVDPVSQAVEAWARCMTTDGETVATLMDRLQQLIAEVGLQQSNQAAEIIRGLQDNLREALAKKPRFRKKAVEAVLIKMITTLSMLPLDPMLKAITPEVQQLVIEATRFLERFFGS